MAQDPEAYPEKIDISNCDKEPIHIIGKTQAHGVLLACNPETLIITQAGENASLFFGKDYREILGLPLGEVLGKNPVKKLKQYHQENRIFSPEEVEVNNKKLLMLDHRSGANLIVEFEEQGNFWDPLFFSASLPESLIT